MKMGDKKHQRRATKGQSPSRQMARRTKVFLVNQEYQQVPKYY